MNCIDANSIDIGLPSKNVFCSIFRGELKNLNKLNS